MSVDLLFLVESNSLLSIHKFGLEDIDKRLVLSDYPHKLGSKFLYRIVNIQIRALRTI